MDEFEIDFNHFPPNTFTKILQADKRSADDLGFVDLSLTPKDLKIILGWVESAKSWAGYLDIIKFTDKAALELGLHLSTEPLEIPKHYFETVAEYLAEAAKNINLRDRNEALETFLKIVQDEINYATAHSDKRGRVWDSSNMSIALGVIDKALNKISPKAKR